MPNKTYALEWMGLALRNLETARLLIREEHFTDRYPGPRYVIPPRKEVEELFPLVEICLSEIDKHIKKVC